MAYLGNDLQVAFPSYRNIDDISGSFNGVTTSFALTVDGVAPIPAPINSQQCLISVNGVVQRPDDSGTEGFRLSGGNIIFASAPAGGVDFFGVILAGADYVNVGANFPSGTAAAPSITFDSDLDTGIYNPAGNQIGFTTSGTQRLVINSSGQISSGLGTAAAPAFSFISDPNTGIYSPGADQLALSTNGTGRLFVDASGRVLVGTSSALGSSAASYSKIQSIGNTNFSNSYGALTLGRDAAATSIGTNQGIGYIRFSDNAGAEFATIACEADATAGAGDYPGRIIFLTTADGAPSPTERLRITSAGLVGIGTSAPSAKLDVLGAASDVCLSLRTEGIDNNQNSPYLFFGAYQRQTAAIRGVNEGPNGQKGLGFYTKNVSDTTSGPTATGFAERVRITKDGLVGIGTSTVGAKLHVSNGVSSALISSNADDLIVENSDNCGITVGTPNASTGSIRFADPQRNNSGGIFYDHSADSLWFVVNGTETTRIDSSGRILVGTSSGHTVNANLQVVTSAGQTLLGHNGANNTTPAILTLSKSRSTSLGSYSIVQDDDGLGGIYFRGDDGTDIATAAASIDCYVDGTPGANDMPGRLVFSTTADGASSPTPRWTITSSGLFYTANGDIAIRKDVSSGGQLIDLNRRISDGILINFQQDSVQEGSISVSGTTVSYNGAHLSRWSQLSGIDPYDKTVRPEILRGTVMSNLDEMCDWTCPTSGDCQDNEQLNKTKISDVEGDKNVAGVFQAWDDDDDTWVNDFYLAMTGDFVIRISAGTTVQRGDLLVSAGDGTAKPQDDDIIRSKTIAKVTSTNVSCTHPDGSYCVPCVLMAC